MFLGVIPPDEGVDRTRKGDPVNQQLPWKPWPVSMFYLVDMGFFHSYVKRIRKSLYRSKFSPWHCGWASEILHQAGYLLGFLERFFVNHGILMGCLPSINNQLVQDFLQLQAWASCLSCLARRFLRASPGDDEILYWRQYGYLTNDPWKSINKLKKKFQHTHTYIYIHTLAPKASISFGLLRGNHS